MERFPCTTSLPYEGKTESISGRRVALLHANRCRVKAENRHPTNVADARMAERLDVRLASARRQGWRYQRAMEQRARQIVARVR